MVTNRKCFGCGRKATISPSYSNKGYCDPCFMKLIEKRVRKDLRINRKIGKDKRIKLLNDGSKEYRVARMLLEKIFGKNLRIEETGKTEKDAMIPTNLDRENRNNLEVYLKNSKKKPKKKTILQNVLEEEMLEICRIKKIPEEKKEKKNPLIEDVEKAVPGTKFALAKSFEKIFPQ